MSTALKKQDSPYHHGNLRQALIDATLSLIAEKGMKSFTIREVAKRAGVSHAAPYRHFKDKEALLSTVAVEGFDMVIADTRRRFERCKDDVLSCFQESGLVYIDFAATYPSHYRVMFSSGEHLVGEELEKRAKEAFTILYSCICNCQSQNLIRPDDPFELAMAAWSIVHGYAMLIIDGFIRDPSDRLKYVITEALYFGLHTDKGPVPEPKTRGNTHD
jgi:AcrR family transcriptional regulator